MAEETTGKAGRRPPERKGWGPGSGTTAELRRRQRFPDAAALEAAARRRIPRFAWDFLMGGTGEDRGVARNRAALDAVEIVPRYGAPTPPDTSVTLFGTTYAAPVGIAPVGMDELVWPGATRRLAAAAAKARIPYAVGTLAGAPIEEVAAIAGDCAWMQLYGLPGRDHAVTFDLVARAAAAGVRVLVATLDAPVRSKRPRDLRNGLAVPFRPRLSTVLDVARSLPWALALLRAGTPRCGNMERYVPQGGDAVFDFVQSEIKGTFDWATVARLREAWPGALVVKGVMHPDDADRAITCGVDGILVSNHGGRQFDAAPASIDVLPAIAERVGTLATVLYDGSVRGGLDVARAVACGASAAFAGRFFLTGLAALGDDGADFACDLVVDEYRTALAQAGAADLAALRGLAKRHRGAFAFAEAEPAR